MGRSRDTLLPLNPILDLIRENSAKKVSKEAGIKGIEILENLSQEIITKANLYAKNAKRKTLMASDIELSNKHALTNSISERIPFASIEILMRKQGASRISDEAVIAMRKILEGYIGELSLKAVKIINHSKRKVITGDDLELAQM